MARIAASVALALALALTGCAGAPPALPEGVTPPEAGPGKTMPAEGVALSRVMFGSCQTTARPLTILSVAAAEKPDLVVYMGDNVYGDVHGGDHTLAHLRQTYADLAANPDFQALRKTAPMRATWDDHDYGDNDVGAAFKYRDLSEHVFENFWNASAAVRGRPGVYDAFIQGPPGKRVQIILLDTRFFRTKLTDTDERGAKGKERYLPSDDPDQSMLGAAQWAWLERQLKQPAELRVLVSSIQVLADGHGWEAWRTMPKEQSRLYDLIRSSGAKGLVLLSGDRHAAALYRQEGIAAYPLYEMTTSSLNLAFIKETDEMSSNQLGPMFIAPNYGMMDIDWAGRALTLSVKDETGAVVRERRVVFDEIGAG